MTSSSRHRLRRLLPEHRPATLVAGSQAMYPVSLLAPGGAGSDRPSGSEEPVPSGPVVEDGPSGTVRTVTTGEEVGSAGWARLHRLRLAILDSVLVGVALTVAFVARVALGIPGGDVVVPTMSYVLITLVLGPAWLFALTLEKSRDRRIVGIGLTEYRRVFQGTWKFFAMVAVISYLVRFDLARGYVAVAMPVGMVLLLVGRYRARVWLRRHRESGECMSPLVVAGSRTGAEDLITELAANPSAGYVVVGACIPDGDRCLGELVAGVPILGDVLDVPAAVRATGAKSVAVGGCDSLTASVVQNLGWELETTGTELIVAPGLVDVAGPRVVLSPAEGLSLVHVDAATFSGVKYLVKSSIDWLLALFALTFLALPLTIVAVAVKATSAGPVLYRQERIGLDGRPFMMLKFRSMRVGADKEVAVLADRNEAAGPLFKIHDDPRVTTIGKYMRRYSIDELPQFLNVLRGDMSLVGPRPQLPCEVAQYDGHAARRLRVKPGITGPWQVSGRSDLEWKVGLRKDVYYTENWTVLSDFLILARTLKAVTAHKGAY
jgi:exopolysaccharide biosynthesis polyprenyl glycosylphosphotransferase